MNKYLVTPGEIGHVVAPPDPISKAESQLLYIQTTIKHTLIGHDMPLTSTNSAMYTLEGAICRL